LQCQPRQPTGSPSSFLPSRSGGQVGLGPGLALLHPPHEGLLLPPRPPRPVPGPAPSGASHARLPRPTPGPPLLPLLIRRPGPGRDVGSPSGPDAPGSPPGPGTAEPPRPHQGEDQDQIPVQILMGSSFSERRSRSQLVAVLIGPRCGLMWSHVVSCGPQQRKSQKRRADTTTPTANDPLSECSPVSAEARPRRDGIRPAKTPKRDAPQPDSQHHPGGGPEGAGPHRRLEQMRYCTRLIREMLSKKHVGYAWPFYKPVDSKALSLHDYHDIIKSPTDLGNIKVSRGT